MDSLRRLVQQLAHFARRRTEAEARAAEPAPLPPMFVEDTFEPAAPKVAPPPLAPRGLAAAFRADSFSGFVDGFEPAARPPVDLSGGREPIVPEVYELPRPAPVVVNTGFSASLDDLVGVEEALPEDAERGAPPLETSGATGSAAALSEPSEPLQGREHVDENAARLVSAADELVAVDAAPATAASGLASPSNQELVIGDTAPAVPASGLVSNQEFVTGESAPADAASGVASLLNPAPEFGSANEAAAGAASGLVSNQELVTGESAPADAASSLTSPSNASLSSSSPGERPGTVEFEEPREGTPGAVPAAIESASLESNEGAERAESPGAPESHLPTASVVAETERGPLVEAPTGEAQQPSAPPEAPAAAPELPEDLIALAEVLL